MLFKLSRVICQRFFLHGLYLSRACVSRVCTCLTFVLSRVCTICTSIVCPGFVCLWFVYPKFVLAPFPPLPSPLHYQHTYIPSSLSHSLYHLLLLPLFLFLPTLLLILPYPPPPHNNDIQKLPSIILVKGGVQQISSL